jgi:gliding motility-associated-like protein
MAGTDSLYDGIIYEFDVVPSGNNLQIRYVFASEGYNQLVTQPFRDPFAIMLSGPGITGSQNIAVVPTNTPVNISTINNGPSAGAPLTDGCGIGPCTNCALFTDNCNGANYAFDGKTSVLTANATVTPCSTYHVRIMIADAKNRFFDSGVFLQSGGISSNSTTALSVAVNIFGNGPTAIEGCGPNSFVISLPAAQATPTVIPLTFWGTTTSGVDYTALPASVTIPAGQTSVSVPVNFLNDGANEPIETLNLTLATSSCGNQTYTMQVNNQPGFSSGVTGNSTVCSGGSPVNLTATSVGGVGTVNYTWSNGAGNTQTVNVNPSTTTNYTVTATDQCGRTSQSTVTVNVSGASPLFTASSPVCVSQNSTITYTGNGNAGATYIWTFDSATVVTGSGAGPYQVNWQTSGTKNISLQVVAAGCTSSVQTVQVVVTAPDANFTTGNPILCSGRTNSFFYVGSGTSAGTYTWSFPGATSVIGSGMGPVNVTWPNAGTVNATLTVSQNGCTVTKTKTFTVQQTPTASFASPPAQCLAGNSFTLNGTGSFSNLSTFIWFIPNSNTVGSTSQNPSGVSFTSAGTYPAYFTVNDQGCSSNQFMNYIYVKPNPSPLINATPTTGCAPLTVNYTSLSNNGIVGYNWNLGGGLTSTQQNPSVTYTNAGIYTVSLTVTDTLGCVGTVTQNNLINAVAGPTNTFSISSPYCQNQDITVTYTGTGTMAGLYNWNFGGAQIISGSGMGPYVIRFNTSGNKTIGLSVTQFGCTTPVNNQTINIIASPIAAFTIPPAECINTNSFSFTEGGNYTPAATFAWSFPGANTTSATGATVNNIVYSSAGAHPVSLTVTDNGCVGQPLTQNVWVQALPVPVINLAQTTGCLPYSAQFTTPNSAANQSYLWNFGGGNTSTLQNPTHTFNTAGNFSVSLSVTDTVGCTGTTTQNNLVSVISAPTATFSASTPRCQGQNITITYTGNGTAAGTYNWNFGNATVVSGSGAGPYIVQFPQSGSQNVSLTVTDFGCTSAINSQALTINALPVALFTIPAPECINSNSYSFTEGGNYAAGSTYSWSFPGANTTTASGATVNNISYATSGNHPVSLTVTENGCAGLPLTQNVWVQPLPVPVINLAQTTGCLPYSAQFTTPNSAANQSYLWNFGGGNTSTQQNPTYTFNTVGNFSVSLSVTDTVGCTGTTTQNNLVSVISAPSATFNASTPLCQGQNVTLTYSGNGTAAGTYNWNFGNATVISGSGAGPYVVQFPQSGAQNVSLTVTDFGCTSAINSQVLTINALPVALFTIPAPECINTNSFSFTEGGNYVAGSTYSWSFPGANTTTASGATVNNISYATSGNHPVSLTVTENGCAGLPLTQNVWVQPLPVPVINLAQTSGCLPFTAQFNTPNSLANQSYLWNFGGGNTSTQQNPSYTYNSAGNFSVTLNITDTLGCSGSTVQNNAVSVVAAPTATFNTSTPICAGQNVTITYTGTGTAAGTYNWNFGSGTVVSGSGTGPYTVQFPQTGTNTISLTATDFGCTSAQNSQNVHVIQIPQAAFQIPPGLCIGSPYSFSENGNYSANATYNWTFPGSGTASATGATVNNIIYSNTGTYPVNLTVTDSGCVSTLLAQNITVYALPVPAFGISQTIGCSPLTVQFNSTMNTGIIGYDWNFGNSSTGNGANASATYTTQGQYNITLTVTDTLGCKGSITQNNAVSVIGTPGNTFDISPITCEGQNITFTYNGNATAAGTYVWDFGTGTIISGTGQGPYVVNWPSAGNYTVSLTVTDFGCTSLTGQYPVAVYPIPTTGFTVPGAQCSNNVLFSLSASGNYPLGTQFSWQYPGATGGPANQQSTAISYANPGIYPVSIQVTVNGCQSPVVTQNLTVLPPPVVQFVSDKLLGCPPVPVTFTSTQTNGITGYQWNFGDGNTASGVSVTNVYSQVGAYDVSLTVTDTNNCTNSLTQNSYLNIVPAPVAGFIATPQTLTIDRPLTDIIDQSEGATAWNYSVSNGFGTSDPSFSLQLFGQGTYMITQTVSNAAGCLDTFSLKVIVEPGTEVFIPNTFTPDGDDLNDIWMPVMSYFSKYELRIFDRWGNVVFYSDDLYNGWNGKYKNTGAALKQDVYVYKLRYHDYQDRLQETTGSITLYR